MNIKSNLPSILTITLLILTVGFLFLYGNSKIKKAENINSTVLAWENLSNNHNSSENLNITIQNITSEKITYKIDWLVNEKTIDSQGVEISAQNKKIIPPTKKVIDALNTLSNKSTLYQVKTKWNTTPKADQRTGKHKTETLGKWLKIK